MHIHRCCFFLLALIVIINARYIDQPLENESEEDFDFPSSNYHMARAFRPSMMERYLQSLIALKNHERNKYDEPMPFERRSKAITKGDPREFMG